MTDAKLIETLTDERLKENPYLPEDDPITVTTRSLRAMIASRDAALSREAALVKRAEEAEGKLCAAREVVETFNTECHRTACHVALAIFKERMRKVLSSPTPHECAEARRVRHAIANYHLALDQRKHGGIAAGTAIKEIEGILEMPWVRDAELRRRGKG